MKNFLSLLILITLVASQGRADSSGGWSWSSIKETITTKISYFMSRLRGEKKEEKPVAAPVVAAEPAVVATPEPKVEEKIVPQKKQKAKLPMAAEVQPQQQPEIPKVVAQSESKPEAKASWFSFLLGKARTADQEPVTQKAPQDQNMGGVAIPVPQTTQVSEAQAVPAGEQKAPSMLDRLKNWVKGFSQKSVEAAPGEQYVSIHQSARDVASINPARVATPAIPFEDPNLIMGHNDIPVFRFKRLEHKLLKEEVKKIPLLNVGQEAILDANTFKIVGIPPYPALSFESPKPLPAPEVTSNSEFKKMLGEDVALAANAEKIEIPVLEAAKKVTGEKIAKLVYQLHPDVPYTDLTVVRFTEEDLKLLRGLILFEKKDQCHIASGIFSDLIDVEKAEVAESSRFHLGVCLHEMNLPTEALHYLTKTMKSKNPQFAHDSIKVAVEDVQLQYEIPVAEALLAVDEANIPKESLPQVNYLKSKYFIRKNQSQKALDAALLVPSTATQYYKAQYVAAIAEYELGKTDQSLTRQKNMAAELTKNGKDKNILALFQMNLGRAAFQKGKYKDSLEAYQKVPKENSLWIQSLMEEAWVQLQSKDMPGAIGNMHSIQSPYFNGVYKPESYVLRAIAYLSICQYADAFKSIAYLEHQYQPWFDKVNKYNSVHSGAQAYDTVIKHLQAKTNPDTDELPFQVIREAARQRDFLNAQESVNQLIDEGGGYNFIKGLIEKDRKSLVARRNANIVRAAQLREKIRKAATTPDGMKNYNSWRFELANVEDFLSVYDFKVKTLHEGLDGINKLTPKAQGRIAENKDKMKNQAGKIIKEHFVKIAKELRQSLDNDELLKYEVYAGSGENLRYKIAGGKTGGTANLSDRKPAGMHWDFDGEYWEDEIGNYRSSLKNNCQNVAMDPKRGEPKKEK